MKILITGSTGFIGAGLSSRLMGIYDVVGTGAKNEQIVSIPLIDNWKDAGKVDLVIHLAANNDTQCKDEDIMMDANYYWPIELFNYYYDLGCRNFIWASSGAAKDAMTPYARSKLAFEQWTMQNHTKFNSCIGFRFTNVWDIDLGFESHKGCRASMVYQIYEMIEKDMSPILLFEGNPMRDFINLEDVCSCIENAIGSNIKGVFDLGTGKSVSFETVVNYCCKKLGKKATVKYIPCPISTTYQWFTEANIENTSRVFNWYPKIFIE